MSDHNTHSSRTAATQRANGFIRGSAPALCALVLALTACGADSSNADGSEPPAASSPQPVTVASAVAATEGPAPTAVPTTARPTTTAAPTTAAPTTTAATAYPIVVEGTTTEPEDQMGEGKAEPDGSVPYYNLKLFDGGLVGEGNAVGSYLIGDGSIDGSEVVEFTGELVGLGSGTFTYTDEFSILFDGSFTATAEIVGTGGAFENLVGTIEYNSTDFGSNRTFRATFTPAP